MKDAGWIKDMLSSLGADDCGLVPLSEPHPVIWRTQADSCLPGAKTVIVFYKRFPRYFYASNEAEGYNQDFSEMISAVDMISQALADEIEAAGYSALAVPADEETAPNAGAISLRHYAVLGGLGSIGKNNLLLTARFGSMVELGAVITDMPLKAGTPFEKQICLSGCSRCVQACPQQALGGDRTQTGRCRETVHSIDNGDSLSGCWLCRTACPVNIALGKKQQG